MFTNVSDYSHVVLKSEEYQACYLYIYNFITCGYTCERFIPKRILLNLSH